ncbi:hypothetical protein [Azotobacter vinelandii]|uniref:hypothetical protein n=1 Tax=Azotobacter vinelandii TaxID=354 RepID=UPI0007739A27|nr:hypothetical protein [Azotobacter vinelandii]
MDKNYVQAVKANKARAGLGDYGSSFSDFVLMKTLAAKRLEHFGNRNGANANTLGFRKELVRNIGIRVDALRLAELDAITAILECNKQEFVMELLVAGIEQAKQAIKEAGLEKRYEELVDAKVSEAGFSVEPSSTEGYWVLHHGGKPIVSGAFVTESELESSSARGDDTSSL